jgi:hypothetical protein
VLDGGPWTPTLASIFVPCWTLAIGELVVQITETGLNV